MAKQVIALRLFGLDNIREARQLQIELRTLNRQIRLLEASTTGTIVFK